MEGLEADTKLVNDLCQWVGKRPSRIAAELNLAATTLTRPANGKATTRIGRATLDALRAAYPDFPGFAAAEEGPPSTSGGDLAPVLTALLRLGPKGGWQEKDGPLLAQAIEYALQLAPADPASPATEREIEMAARAAIDRFLSDGRRS